MVARDRSRAALAAGLSAVLVGTLAGQLPMPAAQASLAKKLTAQRYPSVAGAPIKATRPGADRAAAAAKVRRAAPVWPAAGAVDVPLGAVPTARAAASAPTRAGGLPVSLRATSPAGARQAATAAVSKARVELLPRSAAVAAGVDGLILRVGRSDGGTASAGMEVSVDYAGFATAYGADWASRLRFMQLPECGLTTPRAPGCQPRPLASRNSLPTTTVSADVLTGAARTSFATLLAVAAAPSGGAGDFSASSLAPSSTWSHTGSTGGFQWSYPMRVPPGVNGPEPAVGLSYSSQSVDGQQAATNNQPSPIGEGFSYSPGFVERQYKACSDDMGGTANNTTKTGDLCWGGENATLSLNGMSVELLKDGAGKWRPRQDDGSRIELLTSPAYGNGDNNNEYWKMTTSDGTQYFFGRHQLPGWASGRPTTNSVLTVPVAGNNPGDPCNQSTFASSFCNQGWRWNLDYVVDVYGNSMSLWWSKETNYYARNNVTATPVVYDRAGYLTRIDYGSDNRDGTEYAATSPYVENTPARVEFANADRCLASCTTHNATTWPDTPWDLECKSTTNPCLTGSPTFWSTKRISTITTRVWKSTAYQNVDSWTLRHTFPDPGDGTRAGLWLAGVTHRGLNGGTLTLPEVTFAGIQMNNRVDASGSDYALAMNWWRVNSIRTEIGGEIFVTYSGRDCVKGSRMPTAVDNNTLRCYPVKWTPQGYLDPITDYFHKYVVTEVQHIDHTGGARPLRSTYEYRNPDNLPLWHHDNDNGITPDKRLSWGDWRGYPTVVTTVGEGTDSTRTETLYYRGMHGDTLADGSTRSVTVQGIEGGASTDYDHFAGIPREQINWSGSAVLDATVTDPWRSAANATRAGSPPAESRYVATATTRTRIALPGGAWRRSTVTTAYDSYGMPTTIDDSGDDATTADDRCVAMEYVRNTTGTNWLLTLLKRRHSWADDCATAPTTAAQIIGDEKLSYDGLAYGAAPTRGDVTNTEMINGFSGGTRTYQRVSSATFDVHGRAVETTDVSGEKTASAFTPATGGPVTKVVATNPLGWTNTADLDPASGAAVTTTDQNGRITEATRDPLGRLTAVWLPGRAKATFPSSPSLGYTYTVSNTGASGTATRTLDANGGYRTSWSLIDAVGRERQTQTAAYGGGRIITDTFYDAAGRVYKSNGSYYNSGTAGLSLYAGLDADMPKQNRTLFDAAGRPIHSILFSRNVEQWRTSTVYEGDRTTTIPPAGAPATTVWTDARGGRTKLWQYHGNQPTGGYDETRYAYHPAGELATVTDAAGNVWSYGYDIQGRQTTVTDPDRGTATLTYNSFGQLEKTSDSRPGVVDLAYTYDRLGRRTSVREGTTTGTLRASWAYDTPVKGFTGSASRWVGASEYKTETVTVDARYRPTQSRVTIPAVEGNLAGTYTTRSTYRLDGSLNTVSYPAAGGLSAETVGYGYDSTYGTADQMTTDYGDATNYVTQATYTNLFQPNLVTRSTALTGAKFAQSGRYYEEATERISRTPVIRSTAPSYVSNISYTYDPAGNVTRTDDDPGYGRDTQCFTYDHQRRLTEAWTPASSDCAQAPSAAGLGGPAKYWQSWSFGSPTDPKGRVGNLLSRTDHATATGDVTTSYNYPAAGANQPHALQGWTRTDNTGSTTGSYSYDPVGNTVGRPGSTGQQTLTWDPEGHLATVNDTAGGNSYLYDADGTRLISRDATGVVLHLGATELRLTTATGLVSGTRYYHFNGEMVAQRTAAGISWLTSDYQGTAQVTIGTDTNQTTSQRRQTPYGTPRGSVPSWPNKLGFVGGYQDPTGLTHLGAREYDPGIGRFVSVDPLIDFSNPQQMNGYSYASSSPVTFSDPNGEMIINDGGGKYVPPSASPPAPPKTFAEKAFQFIQGWKAGTNNWAKDKYEGIKETIKDPVGTAKRTVDEVDTWEKKYTGKTPGQMGYGSIGWGCTLSGFCQIYEDMKAGRYYEAGYGASQVTIDLGMAIATEAAGAAFGSALRGTSVLRKVATEAPEPKPRTRPGTRPRPGCHSFNPATLVLMADGSTRPIGAIVEGDEVLAHDPETGRATGERVTALHRHEDVALTDLVVRTEGRAKVEIQTTQNHPFWSETRGDWALAADLLPGESLRTTNGVVVVDTARSFVGRQVMRDLTVDRVHTYFVLAGRDPVLVHNNDGNDLGKAREEYVAKLVGGVVAKGPGGQDIPIHAPGVGKSGLDVLGPNGEYIFVGGGGKAKSSSDFGKQLKIAKIASDAAGARAVYYLDESNTPESSIRLAKKWFGEDNVHTFRMPPGGGGCP